jgi:hypothetical protein
MHSTLALPRSSVLCLVRPIFSCIGSCALPSFLSVQLFLRSLNGEFSSIILYLQTLLTLTDETTRTITPTTFSTLLHDPLHIQVVVAGNGIVDSISLLTGVAAARGTVAGEHPWEHVSRQMRTGGRTWHHCDLGALQDVKLQFVNCKLRHRH